MRDAAGKGIAATPQISVRELKERMDKGDSLFILDVREQFEHRLAHLESHLIPLHELTSRLPELNPDNEIIVYCHTGRRSASAVDFLITKGFKNVKNLTGGIEAWAREIDPAMVRY